MYDVIKIRLFFISFLRIYFPTSPIIPPFRHIFMTSHMKLFSASIKLYNECLLVIDIFTKISSLFQTAAKKIIFLSIALRTEWLTDRIDKVNYRVASLQKMLFDMLLFTWLNISHEHQLWRNKLILFLYSTRYTASVQNGICRECSISSLIKSYYIK